MNKYFRLFSLLFRFPAKRITPNLLDYSSIIISRVCLCVLIAGVIVVLVFLNTYSGKATVFEWMLACLLFGHFIGFLFGIPRILQGGSQNGVSSALGTANPLPGRTPQPNTATQTTPGGHSSAVTYQQQVNTNLTEISDWLTKIIVGLGLVNLTKIPNYLKTIAAIPAKALITKGVNNDVAFAFAYGTIVTYTLLGFLFGYIITRIFLASLFLDADRRSLAIDALSSDVTEAKAAAASANNKADLALATTSPQPLAINNVDPANAEQQMASYIQEYVDVRRTMQSGEQRTNKMTDIFGQMIKIVDSLTNFDVVAALNDINGGRRLAAYAYLYVTRDDNFFDDLIEALIDDPLPFNQYSAIQALKRIQVRYNRVLTSTEFTNLKRYYDHLVDAEDRKYELEKLFPGLKSRP
jgi:hypothetical protein